MNLENCLSLTCMEKNGIAQWNSHTEANCGALDICYMDPISLIFISLGLDLALVSIWKKGTNMLKTERLNTTK